MDAGRPDAPARDGQRSRPPAAARGGAPRARRALATLAALAAVAVCVSAGEWQRGRMLQKEALGAQRAAAQAAPPAPLPAAVGDWSAWRFRTVDAQGRFLPAQQFLVDNKVHQGRAGYHVVTPLALDDGRVLLVDRGWVAAGRTRADVPAVAVPDGPQTVRGRLNVPPAGYVELAPTAPERGVWQNLDPARYAQASGLPVLPVVLEATQGGGEGLARDWPRPEAGSDKHRIYMMQWYAFALMAAGLWAWFTFRRRPR